MRKKQSDTKKLSSSSTCFLVAEYRNAPQIAVVPANVECRKDHDSYEELELNMADISYGTI